MANIFLKVRSLYVRLGFSKGKLHIFRHPRNSGERCERNQRKY